VELDVDAAVVAAKLARDGKVQAIMKGSLHTNDLMRAIVAKDANLRTARRMSHVFVIDHPHYHKPLLVTDAALNIAPSLLEKRDITQNAIDMAHQLGIARPKVAIIAAVETVEDGIESTLHAAALCKMADRKQIKGAVLDGPLAMDNALSKEAAEIKGIESEVAGDADILVVSNYETGNVIYKLMEHLDGARAAGVVLGAKVPVILTSRADSETARIASCLLAVAVVRGVKSSGLAGDNLDALATLKRTSKTSHPDLQKFPYTDIF
jgi:phosphate acetyltransferase